MRDNLKKHGIVRIIYDNNDVIEAYYAKDGISGFGRKLYASGDYYLGNLVNNFENGPGRLNRSDGTVSEGYFQKGQLRFMNHGHPGDR